MSHCPPCRLLRRVVVFTFLGACLAAAPAPAVAQPPGDVPSARYDDPVGNGIAIGAALGAIGGIVVTGALYAQCDALCDAPAEAPTYSLAAGLGAGIGAASGWLIDRLHKGRRPAAVPVVDLRADRWERAVRLQWRF